MVLSSMKDTAVLFTDHLNGLHSWGWEMVQFTCTIVKTQNLKPLREENGHCLSGWQCGR